MITDIIYSDKVWEIAEEYEELLEKEDLTELFQKLSSEYSMIQIYDFITMLLHAGISLSGTKVYSGKIFQVLSEVYEDNDLKFKFRINKVLPIGDSESLIDAAAEYKDISYAETPTDETERVALIQEVFGIDYNYVDGKFYWPVQKALEVVDAEPMEWKISGNNYEPLLVNNITNVEFIII